MPLVGRAVMWFRAVFRRARIETEMDRDMRLHLEMEIEPKVRQGMSSADARRAALVSFGGVEAAKDAVRDERGTRWLESTLSDFRFAVRGVRKRPLFAAGVIVVIALGIGPNTAIFSVINKLLISPLSYEDGNRMVEFVVTSSHGKFLGTATAEQVDRWRAAARTVEQITTSRARSFEIGDSTREATVSVQGTLLTPATIAFVGLGRQRHRERHGVRRSPGRAHQLSLLARSLRRPSRHHRADDRRR
jgi:hypothetical protein